MSDLHIAISHIVYVHNDNTCVCVCVCVCVCCHRVQAHLPGPPLDLQAGEVS